jgi:hypothetical protein
MSKMREKNGEWKDWTLETTLEYIRFLSSVFPEKCLVDSPTWVIMDYVGSCPWWLMNKMFAHRPIDLPKFWNGGNFPDWHRIYHASIHYLIDVFNTKIYDHDDVNLLIRHCNKNEQAVRIHNEIEFFGSIHDSIRFAHFSEYATAGVEWMQFARNVLQITPNLIVVSIQFDIRDDNCAKAIAHFTKIVPIIVCAELPFNTAWHVGVSYNLAFREFIKTLNREQQCRSIIVIRPRNNWKTKQLIRHQDKSNRKFLYIIKDEYR